MTKILEIFDDIMIIILLCIIFLSLNRALNAVKSKIKMFAYNYLTLKNLLS